MSTLPSQHVIDLSQPPAIDAVERAFIDACLLDVAAIKPGNVGFHRSGHGMRALDFVRSARVAAPALTREATLVGERLRAAVGATHAAVGTNTNLGVLLLAAPVIHTVLTGPRARTTGDLGVAVAKTLDQLSVRDAESAFAAIRFARPGGLGTSAPHDVSEPARVSLLEAMRIAADRDMIARQYATGYRDVLDTGLARLVEARGRGRDWRWTTTEIFLGFLSAMDDSHVARKHGAASARALRDEAMDFDRMAARATDLQALHRALVEWDRALKVRRINPGTSADLTACTLLWFFLCAEHGAARALPPVLEEAASAD